MDAPVTRRTTGFPGYDGTRLAYHRTGHGTPLICLPGGPMRASSYLGDLGGLTDLVRLDLRGTGDSATPADPSSWRCDRQVDDVEALREHLGLDRMDLLGHSAGANLAVTYAARHPRRIARLVLVTPSPRAVGIEVTAEDRLAATWPHRDEPWYGPAAAALDRVLAGQASGADWAAITPLTYGRWDGAARAHAAGQVTEQNRAAASAFSVFDPASTRAALATLDAPVLVLAGDRDLFLGPANAATYAALFPRGQAVVQPGGGHYPWLDAPAFVVGAVSSFRAAS